MRVLKSFTCLGLALFFAAAGGSTASAEMGDMGFFGGISEGTRLPKTTEILLAQSTSKNNRQTASTELVYKEVIFLSGTPYTFEGLLSVRRGGISDDAVGTTTETYVVRPSASTQEGVSVERTITFTVNFRREGNQLIKDYEVRNWSETVTTPENVYVIDPTQSRYGISIIEDHTPGVTYFKGNVSQRAVYAMAAAAAGQPEGEQAAGEEPAVGEEQTAAQTATSPTTTTLETSGSFYGYSSAWSSAETHRIDAAVYNNKWQMQVQIRPSVSVSKLIQYDKNEPTAISFPGNYKEVMQNTSGLEYDIFIKPKHLTEVADTGNESISSYNSFEQLIAPDMSFLKGHFAEADISKLFAMQVLEGDPRFYQPAQATTRGQYVTALVKAVKMPITPVDRTKKARKNDVVNIVFPDVGEERAEYPYIMAAYKGGLAVGRENSNFAIDQPIDRQEAIVILIRTLGLENLGLTPTPVTSFADDYKIAPWARKEIYAAQSLGIISGDEDGNFRPVNYITKAEAAAFVNRLIDYMRADLATDYTEHIVNYAN